jgi:hypothetical protein
VTKSLNSAGLAVCFLMALVSAPALAYSIDTYAYTDGPDSVSGWSYTDLDADDWYEWGAIEADVNATIWLNSTQLDYDSESDCGDPGEEIDAEAYVYAGDGYGWYEVVGDHWLYGVYGWVYLGEDSYWAFLNLCSFPSGETETYTYPSPGSGPPYTTFYMTLSTYSFIGRWAQEQWAGGDPVDVCSGANLQAAMSTPQFVINPSNGYVDTIGERPGVIQDLRSMWFNGTRQFCHAGSLCFRI